MRVTRSGDADAAAAAAAAAVAAAAAAAAASGESEGPTGDAAFIPLEFVLDEVPPYLLQ